MPETTSLTLLLLPIAAAAGWLLAMHFRPSDETRSVNPDYLRGLQYLVNEEADKAIEIFINIAGIDNETVETHLALGNLFRRQGQVDRALKLHQNLVARPHLDARHRNQARYELARDYLTAGVLDRAEALLADLVAQGVMVDQSLEGLIRIYEQERDWEKAMQAMRRLEAARGESMPTVIAQYHCELAAQASAKSDMKSATRHIKKALGEDRQCVRAMVLEGDFQRADGNYRQAEKAYHRALRNRPDLAGEILDKLWECFRQRDAIGEWEKSLVAIADNYPSTATRIARSKFYAEQERAEEAIHYLSQELEDHPNWQVFAELLRLSEMDGDPRYSGLDKLKESLQKMVAVSPQYRCEHCGFEGRHLHWQCPSCRRWDSQRAVKDILHEGPVAGPAQV